MEALYQPLRTTSLKEEFILHFENLILSQQLTPGHRLPPERELARQMEISRTVVREGILELASRGLLSIRPRKGTIVTDYRKEGTLSLLMSMLHHQPEEYYPHILDSLLQARRFMEREFTRLAAQNRSRKNLHDLQDLLQREEHTPRDHPQKCARVDFTFHHTIALAGGNSIYPLLLNSLKEVYLSLLTEFFGVPGVAKVVFSLHRDLVARIKEKDEKEAVNIMTEILDYGEAHLRKTLGATRG